jgi:hypothetical protein
MLQRNLFSRPGWLVATLAVGFTLPSRSDAQLPNQAVTVHGHWVIEVRNADGTLHSSTAFDNALTQMGKNGITQLLSGLRVVESWLVHATSSAPPCSLSTGAAGQCVIQEGNGPVTSPTAFKTLTRTVSSSGDQVILQGTFVASRDGTISDVSTTIYTRLADYGHDWVFLRCSATFGYCNDLRRAHRSGWPGVLISRIG